MTPAAEAGRRPDRPAVLVGLLCGGVMLALGGWGLLAPRSFALWTAFAPYNPHLVHDLGAFQVGIGATVLLALLWHDSLGVALSGFVVADNTHAVNHAVDRHLGGHDTDSLYLAVLAGLALLGLASHLRRRSRRVSPWHTRLRGGVTGSPYRRQHQEFPPRED